jgi:heat shock protein HtpX
VLSLDELRGVIGHELAHFKNRDTLTAAIAATVAGVLAYVAHWGWLLGGGRNRDSNPLLLLVTLIFAPIAAVIIQAMISRSREYVADADGAHIAGSAGGLISALQKLEAYSQRVPMMNPNPAQNSMFIVEPFTGQSLMNLFSTHPPMEKRIDALRRVGAQISGRMYYQ